MRLHFYAISLYIKYDLSRSFWSFVVSSTKDLWVKYHCEISFRCLLYNYIVWEFWRESFYYFICLSFVCLFVFLLFFYLFWFLFFLLLINVTVYIHWSTKKNRIRNVIHVASLKLVLFQYHMSQLNCYYYKRINYSVVTICMDYNELLIKKQYPCIN